MDTVGLPHIHVSAYALAWISSVGGQAALRNPKRKIGLLADHEGSEFVVPVSKDSRHFTIDPGAKLKERIEVPIYQEEFVAFLCGCGLHAELDEDVVDSMGGGVLRMRW